jgi:hypothetical protein
MKPISLNKHATRRMRGAHRNMGVVIAVFLLLFALTGILLNHSHDLALDRLAVPAIIAGRYYGDETVNGFEIDGRFVYQLSETLFLDRIPVAVCEGQLAGAAAIDANLVAACDGELIVFTGAGALVERLGSAHGIPAGISALAGRDGLVLLQTADGVKSLDLATLAVLPAATAAWPSLVTVPGDVLMAETVTWERFILDLHSARFIGAGGVWLSDFLALLLIVLSVSGTVMWLLPRRENGCSKP